jgi:hypothetical protein
LTAWSSIARDLLDASAVDCTCSTGRHTCVDLSSDARARCEPTIPPGMARRDGVPGRRTVLVDEYLD